MLEVVLLEVVGFKAVVLQVAKLELFFLQALVVKFVLVEAVVLEDLCLQALLLCKGCNEEAEVFKALVDLVLLLLDVKLKGLSTATVKLKLIKIQAGKLQGVQHAGGKAVGSSPP